MKQNWLLLKSPSLFWVLFGLPWFTSDHFSSGHKPAFHFAFQMNFKSEEYPTAKILKVCHFTFWSREWGVQPLRHGVTTTSICSSQQRQWGKGAGSYIPQMLRRLYFAPPCSKGMRLSKSRDLHRKSKVFWNLEGLLGKRKCPGDNFQNAPANMATVYTG